MPNKKKSNQNRRQASTSRGRKQGSSAHPAKEQDRDRESMGNRQGSRQEDEGGLESEPSSRSGRASST